MKKMIMKETWKKTRVTKLDRKRKSLVEDMVEDPVGWIMIPVVFFLQQTMQTAATMTHKNMRPMIPPTTAPMIVPTGL